MIIFDSYFSNGLVQPPISMVLLARSPCLKHCVGQSVPIPLSPTGAVTSDTLTLRKCRDIQGMKSYPIGSMSGIFLPPCTITKCR